MKTIIAIAILLNIVLSLDCPAGQNYVKFKKQNKNWATEESWVISQPSGSTLYTSPALVNDQLYTAEACIDSTTNNQYSIALKDSFGDSWSTGSYLEIQGAYEQIYFKGFLVATLREDYPLSLNTPIPKNDVWKFSNTEAMGWNTASFGDSGWTSVTLGNPSTASSGTQYLRHTFTGVADMAAYEVQFYYRFGIIAYINGAEIYRDNMPEGSVTSATHASGSYDVLAYKGVIRNGGEMSTASSVLAIEIHFTVDTTQTNIDFNAFLSMYASGALESNCYNYPYTVSITSSAGTNPGYCMNYAKGDYFYMSSMTSPPTLSFVLTNNAIPVVNSVRFFPSTNPIPAPKDVLLTGSYNQVTGYNTVINGQGITYVNNEWNGKSTLFNARNYPYYKLLISAAGTSYMYMYEMGLAVCNLGASNEIKFEKTSYSFYALYEEVDIHPVVPEFTGCTISPTPSNGVIFDPATCSLSGISTVVATIVFTVSAVMFGSTYTGTINIAFTNCAGSMLEVERIYKYNAAYEFYSIVDQTTQQVVQSVTSSSGQVNNVDVRTLFCVTGTSYAITTDSSQSYWYPLSFLYVNTVLYGAEKERLVRARFDSYLGLSTAYTFNAGYLVAPRQTWKYKFGELPSGWTTGTGDGWSESSFSSFPASANRIQLYKKSFNVASVSGFAGFVLSLRYAYGCVVYMNGVEVFRNFLPAGDIAMTTSPTSAYTDIMYRQVSLPIKTFPEGETAAVQYLNNGINTITVGLVAISDSMTTSVFDATVRLMSPSSEARTFDYTVPTYSYLYGGVNAMAHYYTYYWYCTSCPSSVNYADVKFDNDRREWISSVVIQNFYNDRLYDIKTITISGRNSNSDAWTEIKAVTNVRFSMVGQDRKIWLLNNKPYNQYRFSNVGTGNPSACSWRINRVDFFSDDTTVEVPALSYASTTIFKDIEMAEVYPSSNYYTEFSVSPALPTGIDVDAISGEISGTATVQVASSNYQITARKYNGGTVTASLTLGVDVCTGGKGLITVTTRTDSYPQRASYKVYEGKGTTGTVKLQLDQFPKPSMLFYSDFCYPHNIYTMVYNVNYYYGMYTPGGYFMSVDLGNMRFDMNQIPAATVAPATATTMFSTYLPFQIEYDDWKVWRDGSVAEGWKQVSFDDSTWSVVKANQIGTATPTTIYVRRTFSITNKDDYHVLNVRVRYNGGVVAYFNGRKVARFNLIEDFDETTPGLTSHDASAFSKFHIILGTVGIAEGNNVIAFELHRAAGTSTATAFEFDATGVFGVQDCDAVVDTFTTMEGTTLTSGSYATLWDMNPTTSGYPPNVVGTYMHWIVENLEGSKYNRLSLYPYYDRTGWGVSLYARHLETEDYTSIKEQLAIALTNRKRYDLVAPVAMAGYPEYQLEYDVAASSYISTFTYMTMYCQASGSFCPGDGDYPPVGEGEISPGPCNDGYRGYSYRTCSNGVLGEVKYDKCKYKIPLDLEYTKELYDFIKDIEGTTDAPNYKNVITEFRLHENQFLPTGLTLDKTTGIISGKPEETADVLTFTVYGTNPAGTIDTTVSLRIRKATCAADLLFPKTDVGVTATHECSSQGNYIGTQKRTCNLGTKDGVWGPTSGSCISVVAIVLIVIAVVVIIVIVVFLLMRTKQTKAVGGVKGKKSTKSGTSKKSTDKKSSAKAVKV